MLQKCYSKLLEVKCWTKECWTEKCCQYFKMLDGKNVVNISKMLDGKMWTWDKPIVLFSLITQYNAEAHNTHTHSPYEYMYANPIPMSTFEGLSTRQIWRFPKLPLAPHCRRDSFGIITCMVWAQAHSYPTTPSNNIFFGPFNV
jgi:hypothetical protein